ncbi:MAG: hypothetical protein NTZ65_04850 [Candidatus Berkelbacteria bacterium]|nr:hypothetical protein [Candidatus Berkelbacteria bacterium]
MVFFSVLFSGFATSRVYAADFQPDATVTAVGKAAARAREILNWALTLKDAGFSDNGTAIKGAWQKIVTLNTIILFVLLVILAFGMILKASWAQEQKRTIIILLAAFVLSYFSFYIAVSAIKWTDEFQTRFLKITTYDTAGNPTVRPLQAEDLLSVSFNYQDFHGFKNTNTDLQESVNTNLMLVKLTTWTNYAIAAVLIFRIVILWLLVIFSPLIFPCLAFSAVRNVAIVWLREFGRFLFLGPLFVIFLVAVPYIWQRTSITPTFLPAGVTRKSGIPLQTGTNDTGKPDNTYESGTNIILMPPGVTGGKLQIGSSKDDKGNNLSETDTFVRYLIALLMIWAAIILPFLLLRIIMTFSVQAGSKIVNTFNQSALKNYLSNITNGSPPPSPKTPPGPIVTHEISQKNLPFVSGSTPAAKNVPTTIFSKVVEKMSIPQIIHEAGALPDVSELMASSSQNKLSRLSRLEQDKDKLQNSAEVFDKISNPDQIADKVEQKKYDAIKNSIYMKSVMGDKTAATLNNAVTKNMTHYLSSNITDQLYQNSLNNFEKNLTTIYQGDEQSTKIFQQTYKVPDKTLLDYLSRTQDKLSGANQMTITLAVKAINEIKQAMSQPSELAKNNFLAQTALKLAHPEKIADASEKQEYSALKKVLDSGRKVGDENFDELEQGGAVVAELSKLQESPTAENLSNATDSIVDELEKDEDFQNSKLMWKKHFLEAPVPAGKSRKEWVESEVKKLEGVLSGLISPQVEQKKKALEETKEVLPLMMVSDYNATDIVRYVKAKLKAAKEALEEMVSKKETEKEDDLVNIDVKKKTDSQQNQMEMTAEGEPAEGPDQLKKM